MRAMEVSVGAEITFGGYLQLGQWAASSLFDSICILQ